MALSRQSKLGRICCSSVRLGARPLTVLSSLESCPSCFVSKAAKVRAQGSGTSPISALIQNRQGNVGFRSLSRPSGGGRRSLPRRNTRICRASELGHVPTFSTGRHHVWNAAISRHSAPKVGYASPACWSFIQRRHQVHPRSCSQSYSPPILEDHPTNGHNAPWWRFPCGQAGRQ